MTGAPRAALCTLRSLPCAPNDPDLRVLSPHGSEISPQDRTSICYLLASSMASMPSEAPCSASRSRSLWPARKRVSIPGEAFCLDTTR